jgi:hypothetical protein
MLFIENSFTCFAEPNQQSFCDLKEHIPCHPLGCPKRGKGTNIFLGAVAMTATSRAIAIRFIVAARCEKS